MKLEDDLRNAFSRTPAPIDFEDRVLAHIQREKVDRTQTVPIRRGRSLKWLAVAATIAVMAVGGARYRERQQDVAEARRIGGEIRLAVHMTNEALATVQVKLRDSAR